MQIFSKMDPEVLKEPRGFIKFLEIVLTICAFATATGPHMSTSISCDCVNATHSTATFPFQYPYKLYETNITFCVYNKTESHQLSGDHTAASEFYVFVGVTGFLYSLAAIVFYTFAHELYFGLGIVPKADFVVTILFTILWLISSSIFADALTKIKTETDPSTILSSTDFDSSDCKAKSYADYSTLNVSVIFGFLNMVVWGGNNWFLYKETNWFEQDSSTQPQQQMPTSSAEVQPRI